MPESPSNPRPDPPATLTAEFDFTQDDFIAFNLYAHIKARPKRRSRLVPWDTQAPLRSPAYWISTSLGALVLFLCSWAGQKLRIPASSLFFTIIWLGYFFCAASLAGGLLLHLVRWAEPSLLRRHVAKSLRAGKNQGIFCRKRVTLTPESIAETSDFQQSATRWPVVERIVRDGAYAYIYLSAVSALVVPQRAFASAAAFEEFVRTAERYLENAAVIPA